MKRLSHPPLGYPRAVLSLAGVPCPLQHACGWHYTGDIRGESGFQSPARRQAWQRRTHVWCQSLADRQVRTLFQDQACHLYSHHRGPAACPGSGTGTPAHRDPATCPGSHRDPAACPGSGTGTPAHRDPAACPRSGTGTPAARGQAGSR